MNIVAAVFADFEHTFLGGPSQLRARLGSRSVIGHTLARLNRIGGLTRRCLFVRGVHAEAAHQALAEAQLAGAYDVLAIDSGVRPRRQLIRAARKWGLRSWRGTLLGTTWSDEFIEPLCVAQVLDHYDAEGVLCIDGHQAALDPGIANAMLQHQTQHAEEAHFTFTAAPPGLAGVLLRRQTVRNLLGQNLPLGILLAYRPEMPQGDPLTRPVCCPIDGLMAQTQARVMPDTRRATELLTHAMADLGEDCSAEQLCAWLRRTENGPAGDLPIEIELELTTADSLPETTLRPRGRRVPQRQLSDFAAVDRLARELTAYDDRLVFLGGHGDPLLHPEFAQVCRIFRQAGVCGLGAATALCDLPDRTLEALFEHQVDILQVRLDANSAETFRQVHGADLFDRVIANIERLEQARRDRVRAQPIIVCSLIRSARTLGDLEAFYDRWIKATGTAVIEGYNDYGGLLPADDLINLAPPGRAPCRRVGARLMLLADGKVAQCHQDVGGSRALGSWISEPITAIWRGEPLRRLHDSQAVPAAEPEAPARGLRRETSGIGDHALGAYPLCQRCHEWHRD
jgi:hypothetical protein